MKKDKKEKVVPEAKEAETQVPAKKSLAKKTKKVEKPKVEVAEPKAEVVSGAEPFVEMDTANEQQILAEIGGRGTEVADELVYSFRDKTGKEVVGLSWVGTKLAAYYMRQKRLVNLSVMPEGIICEKDMFDEEYVIFRVPVQDLISKAVAVGVKRQWIKTRVGEYKNGNKVGDKVIDNPFWYEVGMSKAQRNAYQALMPADWLATQVQAWVKDNKVKMLQGNGGGQSRLSAVSIQKIKPLLDRVNTSKTKEELEKIQSFVTGEKRMNGEEKNFLAKAIVARLGKI